MANTSRDEILRALREVDVDGPELPDLNQAWTTYDDRVRQFSQVLESVGGRAIVVRSVDDINRELATLACFAQARRVCTQVAGIGRANVDLDQANDPHQLEDVDFFIAPGEFGVAENGAIWITDVQTKHRVLFFLTQHLALVLPADQIVDNMHQAYARLSFAKPHFGLFLSGPSKTADIEQALVIGAHGARSMTVFLLTNN